MQSKFLRFSLIIFLLTSNEAKFKTNFKDFSSRNREIKPESKGIVNNKRKVDYSLKSEDQLMKIKEGFRRLGIVTSKKNSHQKRASSLKKIHPENMCKRKTHYDSKIRKARKPKVRESMIEKIMKTTTKDPKKPKSGDPGMEYSEYYNEDDLNDLTILKTEKDNFKIRSARQVDNTLDRKAAQLSNFIQNEDKNQNQIYDPSLAYRQNSFLLADPRQIGYIPYPQYFYPSQYINQVQNPNKISPFLEKSVDERENNGINLNRKREVTTSNSSTSGSTSSSTTEVCTFLSDTNCTNNHSILEKKVTTSALLKANTKKDARPINSLVPFINQEQQNLNQILTKIVDELEDLKAVQVKKSHKEGQPCKLPGSWETSQAGIKLNIKVTQHSLTITTEKLESLKHEGILNTTWNITGHTPFRNGGPFFLSAVNNQTKSVAVFVGTCRICQGTDTIKGIWTVSHTPEDCRDFQTATGIYNDIFRRTGSQTKKPK